MLVLYSEKLLHSECYINCKKVCKGMKETSDNYSSYSEDSSISYNRECVREIYKWVLGREPDPAGLEAYANSIVDKGSLPIVAFRVASSDEAYNRHGNSFSLAKAIRNLVLEFGAGSGWSALLNSLATNGEIKNLTEKEVFEMSVPDSQIIGRLRVNLDERLSGWVIDLSDPERSVDIRIKNKKEEFELNCIGWEGVEEKEIKVGKMSLSTVNPADGIYFEQYAERIVVMSSALLAPLKQDFLRALDNSNLDITLSTQSLLNAHCRSGDVEVSDYMAHVFNQKYGEGVSFNTRQEKVDFLLWYMNDYREGLRLDQPLVYSKKVEMYLQEMAFSEGVGSYYVSRLLIYFWKRHFNNKHQLFRREDYWRLVYNLASSPNAGRSSFLKLFGLELLRVLKQRDPLSSRLPISLNRYWGYALRDELGEDGLLSLGNDSYLAEVFKKVFYSLSTGLHVTLLPNDWLAALREGVNDDVSIGEKLILLLFGKVGDDAEWLDNNFYTYYPQFKVLTPRYVTDVTADNVERVVKKLWFTESQSFPDNRLYIVGHTNQTGLGANLWMSVSAFQKAGVKPVVLSVDTEKIVIDQKVVEQATELNKTFIIFHVNADRVPDEVAKLPARLLKKAHKIGFYLWETSVPPKSHMLGLDLMDEVWVPTEYLAKMYKEYTETPIVNVKKGMMVPDNIKDISRSSLGVEDDDFVFLTIGDFHSSIPRKNPLGVVEAFQKAFPNRESVKLILKIRNIEYDHWSNKGGHWDRVEEVIMGDPRIIVFDRDLEYAQYWGMIRACDCFVSLHKAEGFGYGLAHSMMMERPVIASDYSGSQDFCKESTAFLVPVKEVPVAEHEMPVMVEGACWADPDIEVAAEHMKIVKNNPDIVKEKTKNAKYHIDHVYSMKAHTDRYCELFKEAIL